MIPHRRTLFLVKRRSLFRRLRASRPSFVAPTGLRHLPRLRPHPRLDFRPRRARYGFPSPVASFWSCPTTTHAIFAFRPLGDRAPSGIARLPLTPSASFSPSLSSSSRSALAPSALGPCPYASAIIAIHNAISILSIILSYLYAGATPPASLLLPWKYYYSCALSLPFCPALCSRQAAFFCCALLCSLSCGAQGKPRCSARLRAMCLLLLPSALDVVARRVALKYAARCCSRRWVASVPALRSRTGRNVGVAVVGQRGAPRVLRAGRAPLAADDLMTGQSTGPCGVLALT